MKLPRDLSAQKLIHLLGRYGYHVTRQKGSHIRLTRISETDTHNITIPNHDLPKIGALSGILNDVSYRVGVTKEEILRSI